MEKYFNKLKEEYIKKNKSILFFLILILIFTVINFVINQVNLKNEKLITESLYTITETSRELISKIPDGEEINIYLFDYSDDDYVAVFAKKYEDLNKKINVEIKKMQDNEELVSNYDIKEGEYNILIISGEESIKYQDDDLYSYDYNTGNIINLTEQRLTVGILKVTSIEEKVSLYILKGHEKYGVDNELSILKRYIEFGNYEIKELELSNEDIPEDCNTLIITASNSDFSDEETDKIKDYINTGGNILWLVDAYLKEEEFNNINSLYEMYGIQAINTGVVFEQDKEKRIMQNPYLVLPDIKNEEILGEIVTQGKVLFYYPTKIDFVEDEKLNEINVSKTELLSTSDKAIYKSNFLDDVMTKNEEEQEETFVLGVLLEKKIEEEKTSKLMIFANNYFVTNNNIAVGKEEVPIADLYNNKELIQNSVNYLSENKDNLSIKKIIPRNYYIGIENESVRQATIIETIIFAVLIIVVFIKRKNRN